MFGDFWFFLRKGFVNFFVFLFVNKLWDVKYEICKMWDEIESNKIFIYLIGGIY